MDCPLAGAQQRLHELPESVGRRRRIEGVFLGHGNVHGVARDELGGRATGLDRRCCSHLVPVAAKTAGVNVIRIHPSRLLYNIGSGNAPEENSMTMRKLQCRYSKSGSSSKRYKCGARCGLLIAHLPGHY